MSEITTEIRVEIKPTSRLRSLATLAVFWTMLVVAIGVSRTWFGGSLVIELLAAVLSIIILVQGAKQSIGRQVVMSPAEVRDWINAGAPSDVMAWRAHRAIAVGK